MKFFLSLKVKTSQKAPKTVLGVRSIQAGSKSTLTLILQQNDIAIRYDLSTHKNILA